MAYGSSYGGYGTSYGRASRGGGQLTYNNLINQLAPTPEWDEEEQQNLAEWAGGQTLGAVGAFGNLLDVGGGAVRNALAGKSAVDHLGNPFSDQNKVTGRDLNVMWGLSPRNKETGLSTLKFWDKDAWDPKEFGHDVMGLGTEIFTDPLTYATFGTLPILKGIGGLGKAGRAIHKAGLLDEAADLATKKLGRRVGRHEARHVLTPQDYLSEINSLRTKYPGAEEALADIPSNLMNKKLGGGFNIDIPGLGPVATISPTGGRLSRGVDTLSHFADQTYLGRMFNKTFDWTSRNWGGAMEQAMARRLTRYMDNKKNYAAKNLHSYYDTLSESQGAFASAFGDDIARRQVGSGPIAGGFDVGDVVDHADLPGQARVIGSEQDNLIVSVFDQEANEFTSHRIASGEAKTVGKVGSDVADAQRDLLVNKAHDSMMRLATELNNPELIKQGGMTGMERAADTFQMGDVLQEFGSQKLTGNVSPELSKTFNETVDSLEELVAHNYREGNVNKGLDIGELQETIVNGRPEGIRHVPRYVNRQALDRIDEARRGGSATPTRSVLGSPVEEQRLANEFSANPATSRGRTAATRNIPTAILNRMYTDPKIASMGSVEEIAQYLKTSPEYSQFLSTQWNPNAASIFDAVDEHSKALAESVMTNRGTTMYSARIIDDLTKYNDELTRSSATLDAVHETIAQDLLIGASNEGGRPLHQVMREAGMKVDVDKTTGAMSGPALEHLAKVMNAKGTDLTELGNRMVSNEVANAVQATKMLRTPSQEMSGFLKMYDKWLNYFKSNVTLPFASFFMRNGMSGQFVNLSSGDIANPADIARYMGMFKEADRLAKGATRAGDKELLREIHSLGFVGGNTHFDDVQALGNWLDKTDPFAVSPGRGMFGTAADILNPFSGHWRGKREEALEHIRKNPSILKSMFTNQDQVARAPGRMTSTPFIPSPGGMRRMHHQWLATGSRINAGVEWMNRVPMYLYLRKKGYTPSASARRVKELQFDYSELTDIEKKGFKRVMPFYTFQRKMAPLFFRTILERPGGALAQTIKASARASSDPEHVLPQHMTQNLAVKWGETDEGGVSYLTGFGLAHEDPMAYMQNLSALGRGDIGKFGRGVFNEAMSRVTPFVKNPLEYALGESFFQRGSGGAGRKLQDMDPPLGRTVSNLATQGLMALGLPYEEAKQKPWKPFNDLGSALGMPALGNALNPAMESVIGASPAARYLSYIKGFADPRPEKTAMDKLINAFTGLRVTAMSPDKLKYEQQQVLSELMKQDGLGRTYTSPSINRLQLYGLWKQGKISDEQFRRALAVQSYYNKMGEGKRRSSPEKLQQLREYQAL